MTDTDPNVKTDPSMKFGKHPCKFCGLVHGTKAETPEETVSQADPWDELTVLDLRKIHLALDQTIKSVGAATMTVAEDLFRETSAEKTALVLDGARMMADATLLNNKIQRLIKADRPMVQKPF